MTPTKLVYKAWKNTPKPIEYQTNDAKGNALTVVCDFMNPKDHKFFVEKTGTCPICGEEVSDGIPSKKFFSANYTDWQYHKVPDGEIVCAACAFTMLLNAQANRMTLSRYSFCASDTLEILNRGQCRDKLLNPPNIPFVMAVAVSQKKHLAIKSKVSYSNDRMLVNLEENTVPVDKDKAKEYMQTIEALRGIGFTKEEIENKRIRFDKIKEFEMSSAEKIETAYHAMTNIQLLKLCVFVARKMEMEEAICYLGLIPKTRKLQQERSLCTPCTKAGIQSEGQVAMKCGDKLNDLPERAQNEQMSLALF